MGRFKELEIDLANLEVTFVDLCKALLEKQGYTITHVEPHLEPGFAHRGPDLIALDPRTNEKVERLDGMLTGLGR